MSVVDLPHHPIRTKPIKTKRRALVTERSQDRRREPLMVRDRTAAPEKVNKIIFRKEFYSLSNVGRFFRHSRYRLCNSKGVRQPQPSCLSPRPGSRVFDLLCDKEHSGMSHCIFTSSVLVLFLYIHCRQEDDGMASGVLNCSCLSSLLSIFRSCITFFVLFFSELAVEYHEFALFHRNPSREGTLTAAAERSEDNDKITL